MKSEILGATMDWGCNVTRLYRWEDGFVGIVPFDRRLHPEAYNERGWPIDENGRELDVYPDWRSDPRLEGMR